MSMIGSMNQKWQNLGRHVRGGGWRARSSWLSKWVYWNAGLYRFSPRKAIHKLPVITDDVRAWSKKWEVDCQDLGTPPVIVRKPPRTIEGEIHPRFTDRLTYQPPSMYLARLPHARLASASGMIILPDKSVTQEVLFLREVVERQREYRLPIRYPLRKLHGRYYSMLVQHSAIHNYTHWVRDTLMRVEPVLHAIPGNVKFIIPPLTQQWEKESLQLLGLPEERFVTYPLNEVWEFDELYFSPPAFRSGHDTPAAVQWIRDLSFRAFGITEMRRAKRIYISRRGASHNRVVNEEEVEKFLSARGFETLVLEELTFREQVELFSQVDTVVGATGSGFSNLLFAPEGVRVLEFQTEAYVHYCFWTVSENRNGNYWYFFGDVVPIPNGNPRYPDMHIPISRLQKAIDQLL